MNASSSQSDNPQLGSWHAREEARKFWNHAPCDECVYFAKPLDVNSEGPHVFAEKYVRNDLWFHIRWTQVEAGQAGDYCNEALIESVFFDKPLHASLKLNGPIAAVDRDSSMFIEIPELVELPKRFGIYRVRSVARLKRIEVGMDAGVKQSAFLSVGLLGSANRKDDLRGDLFGRGNCIGKQVDQVPSELIQRGTETINEVRNGEGDFFIGSSSRRDYESVTRSIRIVLFGDRIRVAFNPLAKLLFRRLEVKVSPSGFHVDVLN